jgi:hypothetical protein
MLFDFDRWGKCNEAIVAEENEQIVGIVTLDARGVLKAGQPTLDTLYVRKNYRRTGVGYTLFEEGLRRLSEVSANGMIYCQFQSSTMLRLASKLPQDLRDQLQVDEAFRYGDLVDDFEQLEADLPG